MICQEIYELFDIFEAVGPDKSCRVLAARYTLPQGYLQLQFACTVLLQLSVLFEM